MDLPTTPSSDPALAKLQLRKELNTSLRLQGGKPYLLIRDHLRSKYFRLGVGEWRIVEFFDGFSRKIYELAFTIEFKDGSIGEFIYPGRGSNEEPYVNGLTGVAYTRGPILLEFQHVRV